MRKSGLADVAGHHGIAVEGQVGLGRGQHRSGFFLGPIHHVAGRDPMAGWFWPSCGRRSPSPSTVRQCRGSDRPAWHRPTAGSPPCPRWGLVERVQDDADQQRLKAVFCQCESRPLPSGSTISVARFCTSPTSLSVPSRISSSGFQQTPPLPRPARSAAPCSSRASAASRRSRPTVRPSGR
jgi:hypothetical protein